MKPPERPRGRRFPRMLAECVDPLTKPVFRKHGIHEMQIVRDWAVIVGPTLAEHASPQQITYPKGKNNEGVLTVHASGGFATELQHMEPMVLEKLATYFGYRAVGRIKITQVSPRRQDEEPDFKPRFFRPGTLAQVPPALSARVQDAELCEALARLGQALQSPKS